MDGWLMTYRSFDTEGHVGTAGSEIKGPPGWSC